MTKKLGQVGFFKACDAYRTHYEAIGKQCMSMIELQAFLTDKVKFRVPRSTVNEIIEAVGLPFTPVLRVGKAQGAVNRSAIINAIIRLYEELNMTLDADFLAYFERSFKRPYKSPVPVASIQKSSDLSIGGK